VSDDISALLFNAFWVQKEVEGRQELEGSARSLKPGPRMLWMGSLNSTPGPFNGNMPAARRCLT